MTKKKTGAEKEPVSGSEAHTELEVLMEDPIKQKINSDLEKVNLLSSLAGSVQNKALKDAFMAMPSGDRLYEIFINSVLREINEVMNQSNVIHKEIIDSAAVINNMRTQITHLYHVVYELNRNQLIAVLGALNHKLGGEPLPSPPVDKPVQSTPQVTQSAAPKRTNEAPVRNIMRSNDSGLSW